MAFPIEFQTRIGYQPLPGLRGTYPALDVSLRYGACNFQVPAILDSGAMYTVFDSRYAEPLGIEGIETGLRVDATTFGGDVTLFQFQVEMRIELPGFGEYFQAQICFPGRPINRNILGRIAVFSRLQLGFRESPQQVFVARETQ